MPKLSALGIKTAVSNAIRFVGEPRLSNLVSTDGKAYYEWDLAKPVMVRCSTDRKAEIPEYEAESLFMREDIVNSDLWEKDEAGVFIPDYVADHSTSHMNPLYLEESILQWTKGAAEVRRDERKQSNIDRIRARQAKATVTSVAG